MCNNYLLYVQSSAHRGKRLKKGVNVEEKPSDERPIKD